MKILFWFVTINILKNNSITASVERGCHYVALFGWFDVFLLLAGPLIFVFSCIETKLLKQWKFFTAFHFQYWKYPIWKLKGRHGFINPLPWLFSPWFYCRISWWQEVCKKLWLLFSMWIVTVNVIFLKQVLFMMSLWNLPPLGQQRMSVDTLAQWVHSSYFNMTLAKFPPF